MTKNKATLVGLVAVVLWSSIVGLIRGVAEGLGPAGGAAMIYTVAAVLLLFTVGFPRLREFPRGYLYAGSVLFVAYELCLALSLGYAHSGRQAIEVSIVNYLWPSLTLLFAVVFNRQPAGPLLLPGVLLAFLGVAWAQGGAGGLDVRGMAANVASNPLSYGLAFSGAGIWAAYCTVTARLANGRNGITLFFMLTAVALWAKYLGGHEPAMAFDFRVVVQLLLAACAMGFGYAAWNVGILHGNIGVLAVASYFIPIFSSALAAAVLHAPLAPSYWNGAGMVCAGSLACWWATRRR